jgi:hypothetical protein
MLLNARSSSSTKEIIPSFNQRLPSHAGILALTTGCHIHEYQSNFCGLVLMSQPSGISNRNQGKLSDHSIGSPKEQTVQVDI